MTTTILFLRMQAAELTQDFLSLSTSSEELALRDRLRAFTTQTSLCSNMDIRLLIYYLSIAVGGVLAAISGWHLGKKSGLAPKPLKIFLFFALPS